MSAVLPFLELKPQERGKDRDAMSNIDEGIAELQLSEEDLSFALGGLGKADKKPTLDADDSVVDPLAKPHTELSRLLWGRTLIAQALVGAKFKLGLKGNQMNVEVVPAKLEDREPRVEAGKKQHEGMKRNVLPWHWASVASRGFKLFSTNSKMRCPTFDLPAGMSRLGGSCPGAAFAQSTVPEATLRTVTDRSAADYGKVLNDLPFLIDEVQDDWSHLPMSERPAPAINLKSTVCTYCYATGGKYGEVGVQFAEVARFAFIKALMKTSQGVDTLVKLLVATIEQTLVWDEETTKRHKVRPIRVHSSGDFYNEAYAEMWLRVARQLDKNAEQHPDDPPIVLWAPTRTHVLKSFNKFWRNANIPSNFVIRPSAYSVGDPAPYIKHESPTGSKGTSVLFEDDARERMTGKSEFGDGTKFHWQCGVYALEKGNKTCMSAQAPDGKVGCRACWKMPKMAINYVVH